MVAYRKYKNIRYRKVPNNWRSTVEKRDLSKRNHKKPTNPLVLELLEGGTFFLVVEGMSKTYGRIQRPFATGMYGTARNHGKRLRVHHFEDVDNDEYGFLVWMENVS